MKKIVFFYFGFLSLFLLLSCSPKTEIQKKGEEVTDQLFFSVIFDPDSPGCGNCHNSLDEPKKTLAGKANLRWKDHNFDSEEELLTINNCLVCHKAEGNGEKGSIAATSLRSIVHEVHMASSSFTGNCFTCHMIIGESTPELYQYTR